MGEQSKPQGRPWLVSPELASLGPACRPLCPRDAQHGWQLSESTRSPSGGSCPDALQINSVSPACAPRNCSGGPTGLALSASCQMAARLGSAETPPYVCPSTLQALNPQWSRAPTCLLLNKKGATPTLQGDRRHCGHSGCRWMSASCYWSSSPRHLLLASQRGVASLAAHPGGSEPPPAAWLLILSWLHRPKCQPHLPSSVRGGSGCSAHSWYLRKESCLVNMGQGTVGMGPAALKRV